MGHGMLTWLVDRAVNVVAHDGIWEAYLHFAWVNCEVFNPFEEGGATNAVRRWVLHRKMYDARVEILLYQLPYGNHGAQEIEPGSFVQWC
jgi:hypothetical protein